MVPLGHVWAFTAASCLLIAVPGPSVVFTIGRALAAGRGDALLTVVGGALGVYLQVIAVAFGVGSLVQQSVAAFTIVKFAGAAYLVYLGIQGIRHRHRMTELLARRFQPVSGRRAVLDGFIVGGANPKTSSSSSPCCQSSPTALQGTCNFSCCSWGQSSRRLPGRVRVSGRLPPVRPGLGSLARHGDWRRSGAPVAW